jgi:hypothetical protein
MPDMENMGAMQEVLGRVIDLVGVVEEGTNEATVEIWICWTVLQVGAKLQFQLNLQKYQTILWT